MMTAAEIARALRLRRSGSVFIGACPARGYKGAFTVQAREGRTLVRCHAGCEQLTVLDSLRRDGLWGGSDSGRPNPFPSRPVVRHASNDADAAKRLAAAQAIWRASHAVRGTVGETYLRTRGITIPLPADLRFAPRFRHKPTETAWPAIVAAVRDAGGRFRAVHRTYLAEDGCGKAPVEPARMMLGANAGASVHLAAAGSHLVVGEGLETVLSAMEGGGLPGWAALSAGGVKGLQLPPLPLAETVTIAADADPVGIAAARSAAEAWDADGRIVRIAVPPPGRDFNDLLVTGAGDAA